MQSVFLALFLFLVFSMFLPRIGLLFGWVVPHGFIGIQIGCTVAADDIDATDDGYEADDVRCKGGEFEVSFDKDFKITSKEKDEY